MATILRRPIVIIRNDFNEFKEERAKNILTLRQKENDSAIGNAFFKSVYKHNYTYNFDWLGLPIIQTPQDIVAIQEIIWQNKPDIIIETGVARGGSVIFHASILQLLGNDGKVIGIDIDIRPHNRQAIENHPLSQNVILIEGSSVAEETIIQIKSHLKSNAKVMAILDSNHTHDHVLEELNLYSDFVSIGQYLVVLDTIVEDLPDEFHDNRPWGKGNNPKTAVHEFMKKSDGFEIDYHIQNKLLITAAPDGYLKKIT